MLLQKHIKEDMTQEEITVLAGHRIVSPWVMKLCMDVAKAEREACAEVADHHAAIASRGVNNVMFKAIAGSIRARSKT